MLGGDADVPAYGSGFGWAGVWSTVASLLFLWSMVQEHLPFRLEDHLAALARRILAGVSPYVTITIDEHAADSFARSEAYRAAEAYLSATCADRATRLRAELPDGSDRVSLAVDDHVEVVDAFRGATLCWRKTKTLRRTNVIAWSPREEERRAYRLTFHRRHRALVEAAYLPHVLAEGRAVTVRNRQRRLFTNNTSGDWAGGEDGPRVWSHVKLEHPSTFATLAMDPDRKQEIVDDLDMFRDSKDYYASVGKAWKRGYLLFGPPGTGKSTMIAAMANYLDYDVYDLELTAVKSNTELRRLFIETTGKSIIVIEDIDCSIDLTGKRKKQKKKKDKKKMPWENDDEDKDGKVTLSGLLNFIDGLWSACGGERIIIFTTNHKDKLDPALIRRGRMDMHIEMSYCCFEGFKVLAKNYLGVVDHELFGEIRRLLEEVNMTPADVAENLMPRSKKKDVDACLGKLVKVLKEAKEAALAKPLAPDIDENKDEEGIDDEDEDDDSDDNGSEPAGSVSSHAVDLRAFISGPTAYSGGNPGTTLASLRAASASGSKASNVLTTKPSTLVTPRALSMNCFVKRLSPLSTSAGAGHSKAGGAAAGRWPAQGKASFDMDSSDSGKKPKLIVGTTSSLAMAVDKWTGFGSALASFLFLWSMVQKHIPVTLTHRLATWANKLASYLNPYLEITISEYGAERFRRSDFFLAVETYLSDACAGRARKLRAELGKGSKNLQVSVDDHDEVTDTFDGITLWWYASKKITRSNVISLYPGEDERRFYRLVFHCRHRDLVVGSYLPYVLEEGRAVTVRNRQRRLFTNNPSSSWNSYRGGKSVWSHVPFEHPATFDTLAMDPAEKEAILDDLEAFREAKDYYAKVGKAWKRGYLLYGPPGTGKSTMIAAMANFLDYDVYDLELTAVKTNTELRKLFIETTGKSIIVIEDIDCSVDLTGKRKDKKKPDGDGGDDKSKLPVEPDKDDSTKVTLSGLLNFIDGLWSACGGERIIIFTTNHKDKLDPALIRRGRMDKHIEMSYCRYEGFKVLANNYLDITEHELFGEIRRLLEETEISPADVAENLMPMSKKKKRDTNACLAGLVEALNRTKEEAAAKALADAKAKEEAEAKEKAEAEAKEAAKEKDAAVAEEKKAKGEDEGKDKTSLSTEAKMSSGDIKEGSEVTKGN
ncbi:AAA-ATPase ASD, mitochondrial [Dichanthelium oligosanthes]|uniref:AAA-ATPase ASD, mitochondrial n=1 Tax=Dichanthelium oligosanthes TaxID=888268 RepID=A0A1E5W7H2_9POAL|nr:AAA-ATPase ASD, mitochondrial [Dichanthelium oligosanthes]